MTTKKYYWLKLEKNFFKRHDIQVIESMPNGKDYVIFYLKLILEGMNHEGRLRFSETIPYNDEMLATITNTNIDVVRSAVKLLTELNLMEIWDDQTIYLEETNKMLGSETDWAKKKRAYRVAQKDVNKQLGHKKTMSDKSIELDIELEKEKELDIEHYKEENKQENYDYSSVIKYLNEKANKKFRTVESNTKYIRSRYKEGYKLEDFKKVIDTKVDEWKDTEWKDNRNGKTVSGNDMLRPSTLFGSKFDGYLNQTNQKKKITKSKVILEYS